MTAVLLVALIIPDLWYWNYLTREVGEISEEVTFGQDPKSCKLVRYTSYDILEGRSSGYQSQKNWNKLKNWKKK